MNTVAAILVLISVGWGILGIIQAQRTYIRQRREIAERQARCNFWFREAQRVCKALEAAENTYNPCEAERLRKAWKEIKLRWQREIREFQEMI